MAGEQFTKHQLGTDLFDPSEPVDPVAHTARVDALDVGKSGTVIPAESWPFGARKLVVFVDNAAKLEAYYPP